jgi:hypothetical protein
MNGDELTSQLKSVNFELEQVAMNLYEETQKMEKYKVLF